MHTLIATALPLGPTMDYTFRISSGVLPPLVLTATFPSKSPKLPPQIVSFPFWTLSADDESNGFGVPSSTDLHPPVPVLPPGL